MPKRTLLVDGDMLAYTAVAATTEAVEWEPFLWSYWTDITEAKAAYDRSLRRLVDAAEADAVCVTLSSPTNFRAGLYGPYKAGRSKKPVGYSALRDILLEDQPGLNRTWQGLPVETWERPGLEGDDVLGILMTRKAHSMGNRVMWSGDKDLLQIPGWRLTKDLKTEEVTQAQADRFHALQSLMGDMTDGYPGCPGMGKVGAAKVLDKAPADNPWPAIQGAYEKAGKTREDMILMARLARILRFEDYDFTKKEPILWQPPS